MEEVRIYGFTRNTRTADFRFMQREPYHTKRNLQRKIGVSASQLSRIVSGETRTVSSDILIGVAKEFKVSTDYILGLSTVSVRKSYDISELGLSEGSREGGL